METHSWNLTPEEATKLQNKLKDEVEIKPLAKKVELIGGTDISFDIGSDIVYAGIIILKIPELKIVAKSLVKTEVHFPYVPGLLSFREIPALLEAYEQCKLKPDAFMVDGHGIAHPRKMGIATHFGLTTNTPSLGCAKKKLVGHYDLPAEEKGSSTELIFKNNRIGIVYRTKNKIKPVFISPGHLMDFDDALQLVEQTTTTYKLPEPTRQAHLHVNKLRKGELQPGYYEVGSGY